MAWYFVFHPDVPNWKWQIGSLYDGDLTADGLEATIKGATEYLVSLGIEFAGPFSTKAYAENALASLEKEASKKKSGGSFFFAYLEPSSNYGNKWYAVEITEDMELEGYEMTMDGAKLFAEDSGVKYKGPFTTIAEAQAAADSENAGKSDKKATFWVAFKKGTNSAGYSWDVFEITWADLAYDGLPDTLEGAEKYAEDSFSEYKGPFKTKAEAQSAADAENKVIDNEYWFAYKDGDKWSVTSITDIKLEANGYPKTEYGAKKYAENVWGAYKGPYKTKLEASAFADMANQKKKSPNPVSKPIGSKAPSIVAVEDRGYYKILTMDDGSYGYLVPSTGQSKVGLKSKAGASKSAKAAAKKSAASKLSAMGVDVGSDAVDTLISAYEDRVRDMYAQAAKEMGEKLERHMKAFSEKQQSLLKKVAAGTVSKEDYDKWLKTQGMMGKWYGDMVDALSKDIVSADRLAMQMLNGYMPEAYAENMNFATWQIETGARVNTGFTLYNASAITRLASDADIRLLPDPVNVDEIKDALWSRQKISASIAQSILQGESVPAAARRLSGVVGMGANSAVRAARTALTGAQNLGRLDAGKRAKAMGIELKKQWVATVDSRTRHSHRQIDRETVELDAKFANGCMYPGDSSGPAHEVYNCRCAMRYVMPGHEYDDLPKYSKEGLTYEEWKNEHTNAAQAKYEAAQKEYDEASAKLAELKKLVPDDEDYGKLLHGGSKLSDWTPEKVESSRAFYEKKLQDAKDAGNSYDTKWYEDKLAKLDEFDAKGKAFHDAQSTVAPEVAVWQGKADAAAEKLKAAKKDLPKPDGYSDERKADAHRFATAEEADRALRGISGRAWQEATKAEKRAIYEYTGGAYSDYNMPLGGFDGSYRNFVGLDKVSIDSNGRGDEIRAMTRIIERSVTEEDMWVRRGVSGRTMSTFFGLQDGFDMTTMSDEELQRLVGMSNRIGAFQSCGTMKGKGFSKSVNLDIFVPAGSEAMYVEPFSQFGGSGDGMSWDGISGQSYFGRELETIIQRGGSYTCSGITRHGGSITIELELHPEDGYWKFQQEG